MEELLLIFVQVIFITEGGPLEDRMIINPHLVVFSDILLPLSHISGVPCPGIHTCGTIMGVPVGCLCLML